MRNSQKVFRVATVAWLAVVWAGVANASGQPEGYQLKKKPTGVEVGKAAPDFTLKDLDGKAFKLSDHKGKIVVLEWTNHECPFVQRCHKSGIMSGTFEKFKKEGVVWLAIDSNDSAADKAENIRTWKQESKVPFPILLDSEGKVGRLYGAKTTPHMFVIDKNGVLAYAGAIDDDPRGEKDQPRNYVQEAISALLKDSAVATATTKSYGCTIKYKQQ